MTPSHPAALIRTCAPFKFLVLAKCDSAVADGDADDVLGSLLNFA